MAPLEPFSWTLFLRDVFFHAIYIYIHIDTYIYGLTRSACLTLACLVTLFSIRTSRIVSDRHKPHFPLTSTNTNTSNTDGTCPVPFKIAMFAKWKTNKLAARQETSKQANKQTKRRNTKITILSIVNCQFACLACLACLACVICVICDHEDVRSHQTRCHSVRACLVRSRETHPNDVGTHLSNACQTANRNNHLRLWTHYTLCMLYTYVIYHISYIIP